MNRDPKGRVSGHGASMLLAHFVVGAVTAMSGVPLLLGSSGPHTSVIEAHMNGEAQT